MKKTFNSLFAVLLPIFILGAPLLGYATESLKSSGLSQKEISNLDKSLQTVKGYFILEGWDESVPNLFDISVLSAEQKNICAKRGVSRVIQKVENGDEKWIYPTFLAKYFYSEEKDFKKALYWALKGAELGSSECMFILASSYYQGIGVVQDNDEAVMWSYLGAALGDETCKMVVKDISKNNRSKEAAETGRLRANQWMKNHPKAFFSPN